MKRLRIKKADNLHDVKAKLLEIIASSDKLMETYLKLYEDLNDLYANYGEVYATIERVIKLPTDDEAQAVVKFNQDLKEELQFLNDENYLQSVLESNSLDVTPDSEDKETDSNLDDDTNFSR